MRGVCMFPCAGGDWGGWEWGWVLCLFLRCEYFGDVSDFVLGMIKPFANVFTVKANELVIVMTVIVIIVIRLKHNLTIMPMKTMMMMMMMMMMMIVKR